MQRNLIGSIAGGLVGVAVSYVFDPLAKCQVYVNAMSAMTSYPDKMVWYISTQTASFQTYLVDYFNQNYPHGTEFHNILMEFHGYDKVREISWNVTNASFDLFKTIVLDVCLETTSTSNYLKIAAMGAAAGLTLSLAANQFSLFNKSLVHADQSCAAQPPAHSSPNKRKTKEERNQQLQTIQRLKSFKSK